MTMTFDELEERLRKLEGLLSQARCGACAPIRANARGLPCYRPLGHEGEHATYPPDFPERWSGSEYGLW